VDFVRFDLKLLKKNKRSDDEDNDKKAMKRLLLEWHPDKNSGNEEHATEVFRALQDSKAWFLPEAAAGDLPSTFKPTVSTRM